MLMKYSPIELSVINEVESRTGVTRESLISSKKDQAIKQARLLAVNSLYELGVSATRIGQVLELSQRSVYNYINLYSEIMYLPENERLVAEQCALVLNVYNSFKKNDDLRQQVVNLNVEVEHLKLQVSHLKELLTR